MTVVYMKSEVKRKDTAMTAAANEAGNVNLLRKTFLVGELRYVLAVGWISHPS